LLRRETNDRAQVEVESADRLFSLQLPVGLYDLTRVQIGEGPFMSMADFSATFNVLSEKSIYVGTWTINVDTPRYGRMAVLSVTSSEEDQTEAAQELLNDLPGVRNDAPAVSLLAVTNEETRLYEVMPYPRYPRYFRRHWW
jgi:hypothetical protein